MVRVKIFKWVKIHRRHLRQIQGHLAGRNFVTESSVNIHSSLRMQECRHESENYNQLLSTVQLSNNKFINVIMGGTLDLR